MEEKLFAKLEQFGKRFDQIDEKLSHIDKRFDQIDESIKDLSEGIVFITNRAAMKSDIDELKIHLTANYTARFENLEDNMRKVKNKVSIS